ncbi:MAG TPA: hypothetical protein VLS27_14155 [Gammaproteobacteria bacterium]|nr:hypothetical protein [Gammaproteobacteria bacterium]
MSDVERDIREVLKGVTELTAFVGGANHLFTGSWDLEVPRSAWIQAQRPRPGIREIRGSVILTEEPFLLYVKGTGEGETERAATHAALQAAVTGANAVFNKSHVVGGRRVTLQLESSGAERVRRGSQSKDPVYRIAGVARRTP